VWAIPFEITSFDNTRNFVMTSVTSNTDNIPISRMGSNERTYVRGRTTWQIEIEET